MTKSARACPSAVIAWAMSAATSSSVQQARSQAGTAVCTRSMAAPAARSAAISAGGLRDRSPRSAAEARPCPAAGSTSRNRSTISAHIRSDRPTDSTAPSRPATSWYGSSVSSHGMMSSPAPQAGEACAAGSSSRGTTRKGSPAAGTARQVSRSSCCAS